MKIEAESVLITVFGIAVIFGMLHTIEIDADHTAACKQAALAKDIPYLAIKALCQ